LTGKYQNKTEQKDINQSNYIWLKLTPSYFTVTAAGQLMHPIVK